MNTSFVLASKILSHLCIMAKKKKFYVVWNGMNTGIFDSWQECQQQIKGYPGAQYASFPSREEAEAAFDAGYDASIQKKPKKSSSSNPIAFPQDLPKGSWAVDAACSGNPGKMEYRGVFAEDGTEIFHFGPVLYGTNNIGEFLALVHALALLDSKKMYNTSIYSDSRIAIGWVRKGKCNTKLKRSPETQTLHQLIGRAEKWLSSHEIKNPIIKWETKQWGEIPADFGRK